MEDPFSNSSYVHRIHPEDQVQIITFDKVVMMAVKTSATPNNMPPASVEKRIKDCIQDFYVNGLGSPKERLVRFNKGVCTELGLTLYMADEKSRDLMKRVEVTK